MSEDFEAQVVALSGMRHVRTVEGAEFYNLPIGAPITPDAIAAKIVENAAKGITPPKGALGGAKKGESEIPHLPGSAVKGLTPSFNEKGVRVDGKIGTHAATQDKMSAVHRPEYPNVKGDSHLVGVPGSSPSAEAAPAPAAEPKPLDLKVTKPSISGNQHFSIGEGSFSAPSGSRLIKPAAQPGMAYVVTPDGKVHAFNKDGEVPIPSPLDGILAQKFAGDLTNDPKYNEAQFDKAGSEFGLDQMKVGDKLTNQAGEPQFTKNADGSWKHVGLGADVEESDIKDLYDSGDLVPEKTPNTEAASKAFAGKEAQDFKSMKASEVEAALNDMKDGQAISVGSTPFTKKGDKFTDAEGKNEVTASTLALLKNTLSIGHEPEPNHEEHSPLDAHSSNPLEGNAAPAIGSPATHDWAKNANPGAKFEHAGANGSKTTWSKDQSGDGWSNNVGGKLPADKMHSILEKSGGANTSIKHHGRDKSEAQKGVDQALADGTLTKDVPADTKIKGEAPKGEVIDAPKKARQLSYEDIQHAKVGDEVHLPIDGEVIKLKREKDGLWHQPGEEMGFGDEALKEDADSGNAWSSDPGKDSPKAEAPKAEAPKGPKPLRKGQDISAENGYWPGDHQFAHEAKPEHIDSAKPGDQFLTGQKYDHEEGAPHEPTGVLTKHEDGSFVDHETGNHYSPGDVHSYLEDPELSLHAHEDNSHFQKKSEEPKADAPKAEAPKAEDNKHSYDNEPPADAKVLPAPTKKDLESLPADAILYKKRKDFPGSVPLQRGENGMWKDLTGKDPYTYESKELLYDKGQHDYYVATPKAAEPKAVAPEDDAAKKNLDVLAQSELGSKAVEAYQAALKAEPSLANVKIKHFDSASPTPGYASMEDGGTPTVQVNKAGANSVEDTAKTIFSIPGAKELFAKQLGIEPEQMTPDILAQQVILHELGHTLEYQTGNLSDIRKRDKEAFAKLPIPNVPTSKLMDKGSIQRQDLEQAVKDHNWHKTGGATTVEEAIKNQFAAYRQMPGEKAGDEFAAKIMKEHGLLPSSTKKDGSGDAGVGKFFDKLLKPVGGTEGVDAKAKADAEAAAATPPKNVESQAGKFYSGADDPWADSALGKVGQVIDAPKGLTPPSITTHEQMDSNHVPGGQSGGSFHGAGNEINLSEKDLNPEGTVIHEYAHWLDTNVFKGITTGNSDPKSPYFPFWKAVKDSGHLDDLMKETSGKEATYYSNPKEIFARAFAQWIGKKTGFTEAEHHSLHGFKDEKFGPVSAELDKLFESKGLLKSAEHSADAHVDAPNADSPSVDEPKVTHGLLSDAGVKKVGGQSGSNEGGLYDLPMSDGSTQRFYVKKAQDHSHGQQEQLANDLYRAAGIDVPEVDYNPSDGHIYSKIVDGKHDMSAQLESNPDWKKKVQEGYAVDAWLGNRDVFGMTNDNILTGKDGNPYRIDNGGSLDYRAQGEKKTDWGNQVSELAVFKTGKKAKTFGDMTPEQEKASAQRVVDIPDDKIREMVSQTGEPESLADKLIARKNDLAKTYDLTPSTKEEPKLPSPLDQPGAGESYTGDSEKIAALNVGSKLQVGKNVFEKHDDGYWHSENGVSKASADDLAAAGDVSLVHSAEAPASASKPEVSNFGALADGTKVQHDGGLSYTKEDGQWQDEYGSWYSNSHMQSLTKIAPFTLVSGNEPGDNQAEADLADQDAAESAAYFAHKAEQAGLPEGSKPVNGDFASLPVGTNLALVDNTGSYHVAKTGPSEYADSSGNVLWDHEMQGIENESPNNKWYALPGAYPPEDNSLPEGIPAGATLLKNHDISGVKVGDQVFQHSNGYVMPFEKVGENDWLDKDPSMGYHWQDNNIQPNEANKLELDLYHLPGTSPEQGNAPDSLASPGTVPNADAPKYNLGDKVQGSEHLNNQQVGTVLTYQKKDGTASDYTKLDNGMWLTPYGNQMPAEQLNANFTVKHIPGSVPAGQAPEFKPGQQIESTHGLDLLPNGTQIKSAAQPHYNGIRLTKTDNGWTHDDGNGDPLLYPTDELENDVQSGFLHYVHGPDYVAPSKPGEPLRSPDDISEMKPGTSVDVTNNHGESVGTWTLGNNAVWMDKEYHTAGHADMKQWITSGGTVKIHQPGGSKNKVVTGGPIDQPEGDWGGGIPAEPLPWQTEMHKADYLTWLNSAHGSGDITNEQYQKGYDAIKALPEGETQVNPNSHLAGVKLDSSSKVESGGPMTVAEYKAHLNSQMEQGHISFKKYQEELAAYEAASSSGLDVQIGGAGGKVVSKQDLMEAAHAMEAHSSFHIKYGLKNAPDNPITKDQALQDAIKEESAKAFPNLKPKPAFIAYLKQKAGVETGVEVADTTDNEHAPKVNIGNHANPTAKTVQGFDGGSFSPKEVQDAIDILEGFQGKNFKAELNKQNNPLGTLNPNDIVGFDKDKTVTKQKLIDLLKTKLDLHNKENVQVAPGQAVGSWQELHNYPVGTTIHLHNANTGNDEFYTKESTDDKWGITATDGQHKVGEITSAKFDMLENAGHTIEVHSLPNDVPEYAKVPAAVQNAGDDPSHEWTADDVKHAPVGSILHNKAGNLAYTKQQGGTWLGVDVTSGHTVQGIYGPQMVEKFEAGDMVHKPVPGPQFNKSGVAPGKYSTDGGKVYMIVKSDGSGVYVASNGKVSALTPAKVKANHDKGMNVYKGMPKDFPDVSPAEAKKASTGPKVKKGPVEMSAGTYYLGSPDSWKSAVYEVGADGQVTIWPKGKQAWNATNTGPQPLDKIKANYWAGNIVDSEGNSVVPQGHSGGLKLWGQPTTVAQLAAQKDQIAAGDGKTFLTMHGVGVSAANGVPLNWYSLAQKALAATGKDSYSPYALYNGDAGYEDAHEWAKQHFLDTADSLLKNADLTPAPEGGASHLFNWGAEGEAYKPEALKGVDLYPSYNNSTLIQQTKNVAAAYGDGKIMQPQALSKYQKQAWLNAHEAGDFSKMYKLETEALNDKGKVHPAGYLHPGYPGNSETNTVVWGPAVAGEVPAGKTVEGDWSNTAMNNWSKEEVDNYLIKAQMQNPTFLSLAEKKQWVANHKGGNKNVTDNLSVTAETRAKSGALPLTEQPNWTDDIKPAKSWHYLFDGGPFPSEQVWNQSQYNVQKDFVADHTGDEELMQGLADELNSLGSSHTYKSADVKSFATGGGVTSGISTYQMESALKTYYAKKQAAYEEELKKPVYTKAKLLSGKGSHETWKVTDQFGKEYIWKPEDDASRKYRVEMEVASNKLGNLYGFKTPVANTATIDGQFGSVQQFQPNVGDFLGEETHDGIIDLHTLSPKQLGQVAQEHVLDWILDNDDSHAENLIFTPDGDVVGIDKGRGLFVNGNWDGASATTSAHTNNVTLVATKLYDDIRSGKMSEEQVHAAYLAAIKAAKRIQNSPDAASEALVREAVANRTRWDVPDYMSHFDHSIAPSNEDELVKAFLDRKHSMVDTIEQMWDGVFKDSPFSKPEKPAKALGEDHLSGWEEGDTIAKAEEHKVWGAAPIHSSGSIVGGASLLWTDKDPSGGEQHKGQLKVGNIAAKKILDYVMPLAPSGLGSAQQSVVSGFPNQHLADWKHKISAAGKDITKNSIDKNFTEAVQQTFDDAAAKIAEDAAHWQDNLTPSANGYIEFPSGAQVPEGGLLQYKQALDHYRGMVEKVQAAKADGTTTNKTDFTLFSPVALKNEGLIYTSPDSKVSYHQTADGNFLKSDGQTVSHDNLPYEATEAGSGWTKTGGGPTGVTGNGVKVTMTSAGQFKGELGEHGELETGGTWGKQGHPGEEYHIELPTGEQIVFRNHGTTHTTRSQQGRLTFKLSGADRQSSLARVKGQLEAMGLDLNGAEEDHAETVYWRQMFDRVVNSSGGNAQVKAARDKLTSMRTQLQASVGHAISDRDIIEAMGLHLSPEEEAQFWHDLGVETFGADKVAKFIADGEHMPKYHHMNIEDPTANTGMPYFKRIDVDEAELRSKGTMVAIGNSGKDARHLDYIKSGGMASTEDRMRTLGYNKTGASSSEDQRVGGANSVFTRVAKGSALKTGNIYGAHVAYWSPSVLAETGTYSFSGDHFGNLDLQAGSAPYDPMNGALNHTSTGNETMVSNTLSIIDHLEIMVFEGSSKRDEAIQKLKSLGIHELRGLPIEERLVLRSKLDEAMAKVKAAWKKEA